MISTPIQFYLRVTTITTVVPVSGKQSHLRLYYESSAIKSFSYYITVGLRNLIFLQFSLLPMGEICRNWLLSEEMWRNLSPRFSTWQNPIIIILQNSQRSKKKKKSHPTQKEPKLQTNVSYEILRKSNKFDHASSLARTHGYKPTIYVCFHLSLLIEDILQHSQ